MNILLGSSLSMLIAVCLWWFMKFRQRYRIWWNLTNCKQVVPLVPIHPIWGSLNKLRNGKIVLDNLMSVMEEKKPKLYVMWVMFFYPVFGVTHPDTAKILLKSSEPKPVYKGSGYHATLPWIGDGLLLISSGKKWERNRRLLTPAFHFDVLRPYVKIYNQVTDTLIKKMLAACSGGQSVEIFKPVGLATLEVMLRCAFSYNESIQEQGDHHPYVTALSHISRLTLERFRNPFLHPDIVFFNTKRGKEYTKHINYVHKFTEDIITKRKEEIEQDSSLLQKRHLDFLDILITARDENEEGLSDIDIRNEADTFLFEGHDTTASSVSWAMYALAKHPDEQTKVYKEVSSILADKKDVEWDDLQSLPVLAMFMKEVMRMYSPVPFIGRILTKPTVLNEVTFPVGTHIAIPVMAIHHHPDVWEDHNVFRPERFKDHRNDRMDPFSFVPFSAGPRNCIGQHFALNEIKVLLAKLVYRFELKVDLNHTVEAFPEMVMRATDGIKLHFVERQ